MNTNNTANDDYLIETDPLNKLQPTIKIEVEQRKEDEESLPGSVPELSPEPTNRFNRPPLLKNSNTYLKPVLEESSLERMEDNGEEDNVSLPSDLNYSLKGDEFEDQKFYIYKIKDANMVPKKECLGKVMVPRRNSNSKHPLTLEELRRLIRQSSDEMLQDAAKQRFKYLSETYHLVAADEAFTPVNYFYPTKGVFIKLDSDHPFSKPRFEDSYTAKLQSEYEKKFGPISPRRSMQPSKPVQSKTKELKPWEKVAENQPKTFEEDPEEFERRFNKNRKNSEVWTMPEDTKGSNKKRANAASVYKSYDLVGGKYQDKKNIFLDTPSDVWKPQQPFRNSKGRKLYRRIPNSMN